MKDFSAELVREKFVIHDSTSESEDDGSVIALSNRMVIRLVDHRNRPLETFVIRAQNTHLTVRMAARIVYTFKQSGPILARPEPYDWADAWDIIVNNYERTYNPDRWMAIYNEGKAIFSDGEHHPFLDIVENCDHTLKKNYNDAIPEAEALFSQAGKDVKIEHDENVALHVQFKQHEGRCGLIVRGPSQTTTFSFLIRTHEESDRPINIPQCMGGAAAFLEAMQICFLVGMNAEKIRIGLIERFSKGEKQTREARQRLSRLETEIKSMEENFDVFYRPEKPEFHVLIADANQLAEEILEPPPEDEESEFNVSDSEDEENSEGD